MDKNKIIVRELKGYAKDRRNDWSCFDGRSLRHDLDKIINWFESIEKTDFTEFSEMLEEQEKEFSE